MKIAVLGTGIVGRQMAEGLRRIGHEIVVGTRAVDATLARTEADVMGNPPFAQWLATHEGITLATFADAARQSEVVVNATSGDATLAALDETGAANLAGKVLIDIANPLDFSKGMPPTLTVKDTDSLGEQIQRRFPDARVVKALNTMNATVMVEPTSVGGGAHTTFVAGNDPAARQTVRELLVALGHTDILDLGDITGSRGLEMLLPLWLRVWGAVGSPAFQFKVVR